MTKSDDDLQKILFGEVREMKIDIDDNTYVCIHTKRDTHSRTKTHTHIHIYKYIHIYRHIYVHTYIHMSQHNVGICM